MFSALCLPGRPVVAWERRTMQTIDTRGAVVTVSVGGPTACHPRDICSHNLGIAASTINVTTSHPILAHMHSKIRETAAPQRAGTLLYCADVWYLHGPPTRGRHWAAVYQLAAWPTISTLITINVANEWVSCPTRHFIGHFRDSFYRPDDPTNSVEALK